MRHVATKLDSDERPWPGRLTTDSEYQRQCYDSSNQTSMETDLIQERQVNAGEETNVGEAAMDKVLSLKFSTEEGRMRKLEREGSQDLQEKCTSKSRTRRPT